MKTHVTLAGAATFAVSALVATPHAALAQTIGCFDELSQESLGSRKVNIQNTEELKCDASFMAFMQPALTIKGPISVDLNGITISCDPADVRATGIVLTGSKVRLSNGTVSNCGGRGIVVAGDGKHRLHNLTVESEVLRDEVPVNDDGIGIEIKSNHNQLIENVVKDYAGEGIRFNEGELGPPIGNFLKDNTLMRNNNHAIRVAEGDNNIVLHNFVDCNLGEGLRSQGKGNKFIGNITTNNADEGIRLRDDTAQDNLLVRNYVAGNGFSIGFAFDKCGSIPETCNLEIDNPGIAITRDSSRNKIINNTVEDNCLGIAVQEGSVENKIINNSVEGSVLVDLADENPDCDANKWLSNEFDTRSPPDLDCIR